MKRFLCIGEADDPHVAAISSRIEEFGAELIVLDAQSLRGGQFSVVDNALLLSRSGESFDLREVSGAWLRRTVPASWGDGVSFGSLMAAELGAWVAMLRILTRAAPFSWITEPSTLWRAEEKVTQMMAANEIGISYPRTLVTADRQLVRERFQESAVVKPIGTGQYVTPEGEARTFFAQLVDPNDEQALAGLNRAPFIFQEHVRALWHLRVVTVGNRGWSARLRASGLPVDWRASESAHSSFEPFNDESAIASAVRISQNLGLGYSSQDWIVDQRGDLWLIDVNPSGQWLFLPPELAEPITSALGEALISLKTTRA